MLELDRILPNAPEEVTTGATVPTSALRPLVHLRHGPLARAGEGLVAHAPQGCPPPPLVGQATLMDLAWGCSYLSSVAEMVSDFEPVRFALVSFLRQQVPEDADRWIALSYLDAPVRWGFRVRVASGAAHDLNRLFLATMTLGDALHFRQEAGAIRQEAVAALLGELDWALEAAPLWREPLQAIRRLVREVNPGRQEECR